MDTHLQSTEERNAAADLTIPERLAAAALVAGVNLWIRAAEVIPDGRHGRVGRAYDRVTPESGR